MAETNANWDEHLPGAGSILGAAHWQRKGKQAHLSGPGGEAGRSLLSRRAAFALG